MLYAAATMPPTVIFAVQHGGLLLFAPSSSECEPLVVLEFLHRVLDVLAEFVGRPLTGGRIQSSYDVVAQLLTEISDGGLINCTEPDALRDVVEVPGWMERLLGGVLPAGAQSPALQQQQLKPRVGAGIGTGMASPGPAIPWRRSNVRHTSNELYVDVVEALTVTLAPSGHFLGARTAGTIVCTSKVSGVPDLVLSLSAPGPSGAAARLGMPVFHPCVRLARWRDRPGELSFVPPDGRFVLAGYETDLVPPPDPAADSPLDSQRQIQIEPLFLPVTPNLRHSLGPSGTEFEVQLSLNPNFPTTNRGGSGIGGGNPRGSQATASSATFEDDGVVVRVRLPTTVRAVSDLRPSRGDAVFLQPGGISTSSASPDIVRPLELGERLVEWHIPARDRDGTGSVGTGGTATLRCTVLGPLQDDVDDSEDEDESEEVGEAEGNGGNGKGDRHGMFDPLGGYYDNTTYHYQEEVDSPAKAPKKKKKKGKKEKDKDKGKEKEKDKGKSKKTKHKKIASATTTSTPTAPQTTSPPPTTTTTSSKPPKSKPKQNPKQTRNPLMPTSVTVSFSVRGWLPSGLRVDSLALDPRRSRGLGEGVRPYKGVKYVAVSQEGIERRV